MGYQYGNNGMLFDSPRVRRYANGGIENRVAQIAPAGAWRVWAEEETGGEAYIPFALSKRPRSLDIMHEVAQRFGHVMVPVNAQRYANGGVNAPVKERTPRDLPPVSIEANGYGAQEVATLIERAVEDALDRAAVGV